jgi:hypothetical protein
MASSIRPSLAQLIAVFEQVGRGSAGAGKDLTKGITSLFSLIQSIDQHIFAISCFQLQYSHLQTASPENKHVLLASNSKLCIAVLAQSDRN